MYLEIVKKKGKGDKLYQSVLLRQSYREGRKVRKKTIANLSGCSENEIRALRMALSNKNNFSLVPSNSANAVKLIQGKSAGAVWLLYQLAGRVGLRDVLGDSYMGKLALWLIIARVVAQGSRLSAVRLNNEHALAEILQIDQDTNEDRMYACLRWLSQHQDRIEDSLFHSRPGEAGSLFWCDLTSSFFEGKHNHYAAFGYNRDGKKRKRQVVIGLVCRENGIPVSIEAFPGNTQDSTTLKSQAEKVFERFGARKVTMVGDRGLIRPKQIKQLSEMNYNYITALTLPQVRSMLNHNVLKLEDFTDKIKSVKKDGERYIYRRNPERVEDAVAAREERLDTAWRKFHAENDYLASSPRAGVKAAKGRLLKWLQRLYVSDWVNLRYTKRVFRLEINEEALAEKSTLDGCYVWTTNLSEEKLSDREVYDQYKDLKYVEAAFRRFKTTFLEVRPIYVRTEPSTKGHLLVTMLAYLLVKELESAWASFDLTVQEGLGVLSTLCQMQIETAEGVRVPAIPRPSDQVAALFAALQIKAPSAI